MTMASAARGWSLRWRLLLATAVALLLSLGLAGFLLERIFVAHARQQFRSTVAVQMDQVMAHLEFDAQGRPSLAESALSDPRWSRPLSGLYWQLDPLGDAVPGTAQASGSLRSRSLWDAALASAEPPEADGSPSTRSVTGPQGRTLLLIERRLQSGSGPWRLAVAADQGPVDEARQAFRGPLTLALGLLGLLLMVAGWVQTRVGLAPLGRLRHSLEEIRTGQRHHLEGPVPGELLPLTEALQALLTAKQQSIERAEAQAGNLAHALKTPLSVMAQAATQVRLDAAPGTQAFAALVTEQVDSARRQVDWHLQRARAAHRALQPGQSTAVAPVVAGLLRVMNRVHAERALRWTSKVEPEDLAFRGEPMALQDMIGNLLDNASQWARGQVRLQATAGPHARLRIVIDDDGPGLDAAQCEAMLARGVRLDETLPGSGLGLAIVQELAAMHGGHLTLARSDMGGLLAELDLPSSGPTRTASDARHTRVP